jgi:hypothetical protein
MTWFLFYWADADLSKCKLDNEEHPEFTELAWKVATTRPNGRVLTLVSHSLAVVRTLCVFVVSCVVCRVWCVVSCGRTGTLLWST